MERINDFYKEYENEFEEYLDKAKVNLRNNNEEYKKFYQEYGKILSENCNLNYILDGNFECENLSNEECKLLSKLLLLSANMATLEEKEIFFLGANNAYNFFKKIEILR